MRSFMEYLERAFISESNWDIDNSYASLTSTAQALLYFPIPQGLQLSVSSFPSSQAASSYSLGSVGLVNGSLSYLYSSLPLARTSRSRDIDLRYVVEGYRHIPELKVPGQQWQRDMLARAATGRKDTLVYGRLFLPHSSLEALYLRRLSPTRQLRISCVSDASIRNGATVLALLQQDNGKFSSEYLYSTDSALLGVRGLFNFGLDPRQLSLSKGVKDVASNSASMSSAPTHTATPTATAPPHQYGRFSAGMELYYGILNKSGGMSTGLRFTTLPRHTGFPYTMTLTLNPLMGNVSSTYAVKAGRNVALCSQFDFNFYSYESDLRLGVELWRRRNRRGEGRGGEGEGGEGEGEGVEWAERMIREEWRERAVAAAGSDLKPIVAPTSTSSSATGTLITPDEDVSGVVKARWDQNWRVGLLWEGRIKELLFSMGVSCDLKRREQIFTAVGAELQYSS